MNKKDIELLKNKDEQTFEKFYFKYHRLLFSIIYKKVYDFHVTEDLLQESFIKIMEDLHQYHGGNFKYWIITISKNIANMYLRKTIREKEQTKIILAQKRILNEEQNIEEKSNADDLLKEVKNIVNEETYEIIIMHLVKNMKFREIAEIKGETTSAILGKYHRGLKLVRSKIDNEKY